MKLVCVSSYQQLAKWIHSIRLLKVSATAGLIVEYAAFGFSIACVH